jgi:hypothetical protein
MFGYGRFLLVQILVTTFLVILLVTSIVLLVLCEVGSIMRLVVSSLILCYGWIGIGKLAVNGTRLIGMLYLGLWARGASMADT